MNKFAALKAYWSGFGLPAYEESTVPTNAVMPYITYEVATGSLNGSVPLSASVWYRGTSWAPCMQKVTAIEPYIDRQVKIDGGYLKVRRNENNFAQPMSDPADELIRRMRLSVEAEFLAY